MSKDGISIAIQMFGERDKRYGTFTKAISNRKNSEALRQILYYGWEAAAQQIDDYIARSGGHQAHKEKKWDKTVKPPIVDENDDTDSKVVYKIYLKRNDARHIPILDYIVKLPNGIVRQRFLRLALVLGFEREDKKSVICPLITKETSNDRS